MNEWDRIALLRRVLEPVTPSERLGIGDDAATLSLRQTTVISVDAVVEHVHFERAWLSMEDVGFKATMAALSDLAAMGAVPVGVLASLVLPADVTDAHLEGLAHGQKLACDEAGAAMVGGNLSGGRELAIHTTVLGTVDEPLTRAGARCGDGVYVAGALGMAAAGRHRLMDGAAAPAAWLDAWRRPRARIAQGRTAASCATAAIDVSDGLAADVRHLATASEVAVVLDGASLRRHAGDLGGDALELVLYGGEDYALVITAPSDVEGFHRIGTCEPGEGVHLRDEGRTSVVEVKGWDHFAG